MQKEAVGAAGADRPESIRRVYGLDFRSQFPFANPLVAGREPVAFEFNRAAAGRIADDAAGFELVYSSHRRDRSGRSLFELRRGGGLALLRFIDRADFLISPGEIDWQAATGKSGGEVEALFLSSVLAFRLEHEGVLALHASAVAVDGKAVAFLGHPGAGKSWLALSLVSSGYPLISDDILPIESAGEIERCRAGYPQIKADDSIGHRVLGADFARCPLVEAEGRKRGIRIGNGGFGEFHPGGLPLGCLYTLHRDRSGSLSRPRIEPLTARDAVLELIRFSFVPRLVEGLGWQPRRLEQLGSLVGRVPVRRLTVPAGSEHFESSAAAVAEDCAANPRSSAGACREEAAAP